MLQLQSLLGIFAFIGLAYLFSSDRKAIAWQSVRRGLFLQGLMTFLILGWPDLGLHSPVQKAFPYINESISSFLSFADEGSRFLFSDLAVFKKSGFILAFQVLPLIVFISSLMTVLYHIGIMQFVVRILALIMHKAMKLSGAESLAAAANVFVGQTEAPLVIKPYLDKLTSSEMFSVMTGGMATVAGSVLGAYVFLLQDHLPNIGGHLLTASILSAPAALLVAKIMIPETSTPETLGTVPKDEQKPYVNVIEAAAAGASDGVQLAINVAAMLLAFIALIAMLDAGLGLFGEVIDFQSWGEAFVPEFIKSKAGYALPQLSLSLILSWLFIPFAFLLGIPWIDFSFASNLIGEKVVFNEFISYTSLAAQAEHLQPRTLLIMSYALCGFANFSSIAIQIGGIGSLAPNRRSELAQMGIKAVIGGTLAAFLTACWAGLVNP